MRLTDLGIDHLLFIDFETFWSADYTLSKLNTRDYVTNQQFQTIGVSTARGVNGAPIWVHDRFELDMVMQGNDWSRTGIVAHNARFDAYVLQHHFRARPAFIFDTLSMARAEVKPFTGKASLDACFEFFSKLAPKDAAQFAAKSKGNATMAAKGRRYEDMSEAFLKDYGIYAKNDVSICRFIFMQMLPRFSLEELRLIDRTIRAYINPRIVLDGEALRAHGMQLRVDKVTALLEAGATKDELMSNDKFAAALERVGVVPPRKISKATGKVTWAFAKTDEPMTDLLEHPDHRVQALVSARLGVKSTLEETRTARFLEIAQQHGTLAVPLAYCSAHTGRFGGDESLNLQNLTRGSPIRHTMLAPRGHSFVVSDASQIEARVLAELAGQKDIVEAFRRGEDVYAFNAAKIYGRPINKKDNPKERFAGKIAQLALGFAGGANSYYHMCRLQGARVEMPEATRIVDAWRLANPNICLLWEDLLDSMMSIFLSDKSNKMFRKVFLIGKCPRRKAGFIEFHNGLRMWYPEPKVGTDKYDRSALVYTHRIGRNAVQRIINRNVATNNAVQGLARTITMGHAVTLSDVPALPLVLTVHDELVFLVQTRIAERAAEAALRVMRTPPLWMPNLPLDAEVSVAMSYGEAK